MTVERRDGLGVIEDTAHSLLSSYRGFRMGRIGVEGGVRIDHWGGGKGNR